MALSSAKYEAIHNETGAGLAALKTNFDNGEHLSAINFPAESAIIYQIQKMQEELDYLRGVIDANDRKVGITTSQANAITANTAKTTFPGLGTSSTTALAGDTTTISTSQANEITASTTLGTKLNVTTRPASLTKSTTIEFGEFTTTVSGKTTTYSIPITVVETDTSGKSTVTRTKTGSITLT